MLSLVIISDDFTGALDTGVQFAKFGVSVKIITLDKLKMGHDLRENTDVLVIDTETRHITAARAYGVTKDVIAWAEEEKIPHIYIKTDSGLRGNIGSVLKAALDASGEKFIAFLPAYPDIDRTTQNGMQYIGGVPIQESAFGKDPFEPVGSPFLKDLFEGLKVNTQNIKISQSYDTDFTEPTIGLFDAAANEDFRRIALHLKKENQFHIAAGCAGFASVFREFLRFSGRGEQKRPVMKPLLIVCGSLSSVAKKQVEYACSHNFKHVELTPEQLLCDGYFKSAEGKKWFSSQKDLFCRNVPIIIDTGILNPEAMRGYDTAYDGAKEVNRKKIAAALGSLLQQMFEMGYAGNKTLMIIGGDTFLGFIREMSWRYILPIEELEIGTVFALIHDYGRDIQVISKSGSFGSEDLLVEISSK